MGWASYFEDISQRHDDSIYTTSVAVCGPAGTPPPTIPSALATSYSRLRAYYGNVGPNIIDNYKEQHWQRLSQEMSAIDADIAHFNTITLMAGTQKVLFDAESLSQRMKTILARARSIMVYLDSLLLNLFTELGNVQRHKKAAYNLSIPEPYQELERRSFRLYQGWKSLQKQIKDLENRDHEFQITLAGKVQERLMDDPNLRIPIKDDP